MMAKIVIFYFTKLALFKIIYSTRHSTVYHFSSSDKEEVSTQRKKFVFRKNRAMAPISGRIVKHFPKVDKTYNPQIPIIHTRTSAYMRPSVSINDLALCLPLVSGHRLTDAYVKPDFSRMDQTLRKVMNHVFKGSVIK